jgi:hypothetical protein
MSPGLPPLTYAVFVMAVILVNRGRLGGISDMPATLSGMKCEWYVFLGEGIFYRIPMR